MNADHAGGFSLIELVASLAIGALILAALGGITTQASRAREYADAASELQQQAQFAMERMLRAARPPARVLVPESSEPVRDELATSHDDGASEVVYRLNGTTLLERMPNDFTERPIAEGVSQFRAEYIAPVAVGRPAMLDITLTLVDGAGRAVSLNTRVRIEAGS